MSRRFSLLLFPLAVLLCSAAAIAQDHVRDLQTKAIEDGKAEFGHWGWEQDNYKLWGTHSNRLIPVYTFGTLNAGPGIDLTSYQGENSPYRSPAAVRQIYGRMPNGTVNPAADYFDQTNIYDIQLAALRAGKKHVFLVVFDGMDWQTTRAASIHKTGTIAYDSGRGTGLHMQDYKAGGTTQFGWMVTSPWADDIKIDVDKQTVAYDVNPKFGGYAAEIAGAFPWSTPNDLQYLIGKAEDEKFHHAYTDSSSSASSMTAGIKTFNSSVNVDPEGVQVSTIARIAQLRGMKAGAVTSVPISHATPAATYAHNVARDDYQDLTRDLLGLKSVSHPEPIWPGLDVLIGCGYGVERNKDSGQGENFIPGNAYLAEQDLLAIDVRSGGPYVMATRTEGMPGSELLEVKATDAIEQGKRLFGFFGTPKGHLPFQTANGDFNPTVGRSDTKEEYTEGDIKENPTLSDFTRQAIRVLSHDDQPFWLMVEAGDVDWANHDNNIDNSIGAVLSGDAAVKVITDWVEAESSWDESLLIVTADHGHYLVLEKPELLLEGSQE